MGRSAGTGRPWTSSGRRTASAGISSSCRRGPRRGVPAAGGSETASATLKDGQIVTVSCAGGDTGFVYEGRLRFEVDRVDRRTLPRARTGAGRDGGNPRRAP